MTSANFFCTKVFTAPVFYCSLESLLFFSPENGPVMPLVMNLWFCGRGVNPRHCLWQEIGLPVSWLEPLSMKKIPALVISFNRKWCRLKKISLISFKTEKNGIVSICQLNSDTNLRQSWTIWCNGSCSMALVLKYQVSIRNRAYHVIIY